jgi:hypothetical protein
MLGGERVQPKQPFHMYRRGRQYFKEIILTAKMESLIKGGLFEKI